MTAKDKAIELFNKMDMIIYTDQDNWKSQCIRCALIAVDEIIKQLTPIEKAPNNKDAFKYLKEVKSEIEKL